MCYKGVILWVLYGGVILWVIRRSNFVCYKGFILYCYKGVSFKAVSFSVL